MSSYTYPGIGCAYPGAIRIAGPHESTLVLLRVLLIAITGVILSDRGHEPSKKKFKFVNDCV